MQFTCMLLPVNCYSFLLTSTTIHPCILTAMTQVGVSRPSLFFTWGNCAWSQTATLTKRCNAKTKVKRHQVEMQSWTCSKGLDYFTVSFQAYGFCGKLQPCSKMQNFRGWKCRISEVENAELGCAMQNRKIGVPIADSRLQNAGLYII